MALMYEFYSDKILPGVTSQATLGNSSNTFKDLYLSGNMTGAVAYVSTVNASIVTSTTYRGTYIQASAITSTTFKNGIGADYALIDSAGFLTLGGSATVWDDLKFPATGTKQGANLKPDFDETNVGYLFPQNDTSEVLYIVAQMPHAWKIGSFIYPHVHWCQGDSKAVTYNLQYKWFSLAGSTTASFSNYAMGITQFPYVAGSTMHQKSDSAIGISGASITSVSSVLVMKLFRSDNTYSGDALTYEFDIHYELDGIGSRTEDIK